MQMKRYMVVLFGAYAQGQPSVKKIEYGMSPEQALQKALGNPPIGEIKATGQLDGVNFYEYQGDEHIVHPLN